MENPLAIKIEKGTAKLKVSSENFFKALKNTISDLGDLKFGTLLNRYVQIFELKAEEQALAFELVFVPLCNAIHSQIKNVIGHYDSFAQMRELTWSIENTAKEFEILIDESFFDDVLNMEFFKSVKEVLLISWKEIGLSEAETKNILHNLGNSYLTELLLYWNGNADKFKPVLEKFSDNPFYSRWKNEQHKLRYYEKLKSLYYSPAMGDEKITLNEVYICQNFKVYKDCISDEDINKQNIDKEGFISSNEILDIHGYTEKYFLRSAEHESLRIKPRNLMLVLGQPGQGKTSFCIRTAFSLLDNSKFERDLYLLPLREIGDADRFVNQPIDEIITFFSKERELEFNTENTVLILDGLDELYMSAGFSKMQIIEFFSRLEHATEKEGKNLHIIITSRYNYVDLSYLSSWHILTICLDELTLKQQISWLEKYKKFYNNCKLTKDKLIEINDIENGQFEAIRELISQAILLFIIAKANLEIDNNYNRSAIYDKLFTALINRKWSPRGRLKRFGKIEKKMLREYLSHIALKIYQSPNEYITRYELTEMEATKEFIESNNLKFHELGSSLKEVLVNFYFRNIRRVNDEIRDDKHEFAIEFLHKSLQEYLAAECIYQLFVDNITDKNSKGKYIINDWKAALKLAWHILSFKRISIEVRGYIIDLIHNDSNCDRKKELADRMVFFLPELLKKQFLWKYDVETDCDYPIEQASNVFYGYWSILIELVEGENFISNDAIRIDFEKNLKFTLREGSINLSFQNMFQTDICGANLSGTNLNGINLCEAVLSRANLSRVDLREADLREADLRRVDLNRASLIGASLCKANLREANLREANFQGASLIEADLCEIDAREAYLQEADLSRADLSRANLNGADLNGATLIETNLREACLEKVDLSRANLNRADLRETNLCEAELQEADLHRADLRRANLRGASLCRASLCRALLSGTNLSEADLNEADLSEADFIGASLIGASLSKVNLCGSDLSEADLQLALISRASLGGASLRGANLSGIDFRETDLSGADLSSADLNGADLRGVNFQVADLSSADLSGADLRGADLSGAKIIGIIIDEKTNFEGVVGLDDSE